MMQLNVRPGDRAVVVKSSAGNEGKIVLVIRDSARGDPGHAWAVTVGHSWLVESLGGPFKHRLRPEFQSIADAWGITLDSMMTAAFPDAWLRRLPDPDETDTSTDEVRELEKVE